VRSDEERWREIETRLRELSDQDMHVLIAAAVVGRDELASQCVSVGLCSAEESPEFARWVQPWILDAVEATREERRREE